MKKISFTLLLYILGVLSVQAQHYTPIKSLTDFESHLKETSGNLKTIESDFKQVKYLDVFDEEIKSSGKFYYKQLNKIRMQYDKPLDYLIVINGPTLKIRSDGKVATTDLGKNKMMQQVQEMIAGCMIGNLSGLTKNYTVDYLEDAKSYLLQLTPKSNAVKAYLYRIEMVILKADMSVDRLKISETESNYTEYFFLHKKLNQPIDENIFTVN
ncbi:LolA family protein [Bacteroides propionicifaciens]|uniref:LolA family protein n=1 Tax=Bacteroides propionicifaciens TaxID=392838 RepID=UPI0003782AFD|nr:outer membrane lipoprotein carrier protein LolA [Bacteroides propionicifaciens]